MPHPTFVNATDIANWASRRIAQQLVPQLLRRLILVTCNSLSRIEFPAHEAVQIGGWDGIVEDAKETPFVPAGNSVWEIGTNSSVKRKADDDYEKRTQNPLGIVPSETTYVFVTPRRWGGKENWKTARNAEGIWKDVRVYDADDLETWLETASGVHSWLSGLLGKDTHTLMSLESFWKEWSEETNPPLSPQLIVGGRTDEAQMVAEFLEREPHLLGIKADSEDEVLAFIAAVFEHQPQEKRDAFFGRSVIVRNDAAWRYIVTSDTPLILIPLFEGASASQAIRQQHLVLQPLTRSGHVPSINIIELPRPRRSEMVEALKMMGIAQNRLYTLATIARRNIQALRRKLAISPTLKVPKWARPNAASPLIPVLLAGMWNENFEQDRNAIEQLADRPYAEIEQLMMRWANEPDPPVRKIGAVWMLTAPEDAWLLLNRMVGSSDIVRFVEVAVEVLGKKDPKFDLPLEQQWVASIFGKVREHSNLLRQGLATTVAIMGSRSASFDSINGYSTQAIANNVVATLLNQANQVVDGSQWASLTDILGLLGEASPAILLNAIEISVSGEQPILKHLFQDTAQSFHQLFPSSPHTSLLFILEQLAWHRTHMIKAMLNLASLVELDPGGKLLNRPKRSISRIFQPLLPCTTASLSTRLDMIDLLRKRNPEIAWNILVASVPHRYGEIRWESTSQPVWREWVPDKFVIATEKERTEASIAITKRLIDDMGCNAHRVTQLIEILNKFPDVSLERFIRTLNELEITLLSNDGIAAIREKLDETVLRHRRHLGKRWTLPVGYLDQLDLLTEKFTPDDLVARHKWLFASHSRLWLDYGDSAEGHRQRTTQQIAAIKEIATAHGDTGIVELAKKIKQPSELGLIAGQIQVVDDLLGFVEANLLADDEALNELARGFIRGLRAKNDEAWVHTEIIEASSKFAASHQAQICLCLPSSKETWDAVEVLGKEVEEAYWESLPRYFSHTSDTYEQAVLKLLEYARPQIALSVLEQTIRSGNHPKQNLLLSTIYAATQITPKNRDDLQDNMPFTFEQVLNYIQDKRSDFSNEQKIQLEWLCLPLLHHDRRRNAANLLRAITENPQHYAYVVSLAFRSRNEARSIDSSPQEQGRVETASELLSSLKLLPGTREDGTLDINHLKKWVTEVRKQLAENDLTETGDWLLGKILFHSPEQNGKWPCQPVADLIDEVASINLEEGFMTESINSRGVVTKSLSEGGQQEITLAQKYQVYADALETSAPRTASLVRRMAERFRQEASLEELQVELREDLGR